MNHETDDTTPNSAAKSNANAHTDSGAMPKPKPKKRGKSPMRDEYENDLTTAKGFEQFLHNHPPMLTRFSFLQVLDTDLVAKIDEIVATESQRNQSTKGSTKRKNELRVLMGHAADSLAAALRMYADAAGKHELLADARRFVYSKIAYDLRNTEVAAAVQHLLQLGHTYTSEISALGWGDDQLDALEAQLAEYKKILPEARNIASEGHGLTEEQVRQFDELSVLLDRGREGLRIIRHLLAGTADEPFADAYASALVIIDHHTGRPVPQEQDDFEGDDNAEV